MTNNANPVDGNDTLIAGPGNDELVAGSGDDLLIGGSVARLVNPVTGTPGVALLQGGQYQFDRRRRPGHPDRRSRQRRADRRPRRTRARSWRPARATTR